MCKCWIPGHFFSTACPAWVQGYYLLYLALLSLIPRLLPCKEMGREHGRSDQVPRDVLCVVLCVVLIIELLPTQSVLSVISTDTAVVVVLDVAETTDRH